MSDKTWQYCSIKAEALREATGAQVGELLYLTLPGEKPVLTDNPLGAVGLLNELGALGWEAVADSWTSSYERIVLLKMRL